MARAVIRLRVRSSAAHLAFPTRCRHGACPRAHLQMSSRDAFPRSIERQAHWLAMLLSQCACLSGCPSMTRNESRQQVHACPVEFSHPGDEPQFRLCFENSPVSLVTAEHHPTQRHARAGGHPRAFASAVMRVGPRPRGDDAKTKLCRAKMNPKISATLWSCISCERR
jgi:hypothetical protein